MLGVSSLIIISCISDGFNEKINSKLSAIDGHIRIRSYLGDKINKDNYFELDSILLNSNSNIKWSTPYIEKHALVRKGSISKGIIIYGIHEEALDKIFHLNQFTDRNNTFKDENSIIIGSKLAEEMNVGFGDEIFLLDPAKIHLDRIFKAKKIRIVNTFKTDFPEYDRLLTFVPLKTAQEYFHYQDDISGIILNVKSPLKVEEVDNHLSNLIKTMPFITTTWKERHSSLLNWLNIYDVPIKLIVIFITVVAMFNISASLYMIIIEKTKDFGMLQSMGLSRFSTSSIIMIEGVFISLIGSILGALIGALLITFQDKYHFISLSTDIYFMEYLPVKLSLKYFIIYPSISILFTILFTLYPMKKSMQLSISKSLHYE